MDAGPHSEEDEQHGLNSMYDEYEIESLLVGNTIEDEHGLDGKMPGTGTIGGGDDDGDTSHDEGGESAHHAELARGLKAEEGEIVMEEIAQPDAEGEEDISGDAAHILQ